MATEMSRAMLPRLAPLGERKLVGDEGFEPPTPSV